MLLATSACAAALVADTADGSKDVWSITCPARIHVNTLSLAALTQAITRMLCRLRERNQRWRTYDRFLIAENRWRAQRYGTSEGLIDFGDRSIKPFATLLDELIDMLAQDAEVLGTIDELAALRSIVRDGTSADRQRRVHADATAAGQEPGPAVVQHLIEEFHADL